MYESEMYESEISEREAYLIDLSNQFRIVEIKYTEPENESHEAQLHALNESNNYEQVIVVASADYGEIHAMIKLWIANYNVVERVQEYRSE